MIIAGKTEEDIAELESYEDKKLFLDELGLEESGVNRLIKKAYALLNLQTFITAGEMEVKAWTYKKGWKAPQCAGVIHTDFESNTDRKLPCAKQENWLWKERNMSSRTETSCTSGSMCSALKDK